MGFFMFGGGLEAVVKATLFDSRLLERFKIASLIASMIPVFIGFVVLVGWVYDTSILKSISPTWVTMKANTAVAFLFSGISMLSWQVALNNHDQKIRCFARASGIFVAIIGVLTLSEYIFGWNLGIDQLLFKESPDAVGTFSPGRMSPVTAFNFLLLGASFGLRLDLRRGIRIAQWLSILTGSLGLLNALGYIYHVESFYGVASFTQMAAHTAFLFTICSFGILTLKPTYGLMAVATNATSGGILVRRLVPVAFVVPIVLGWLSFNGERLGLFQLSFGTAFFVVANVIIFAALAWRTARLLYRFDVHSKLAQRTLSSAHERLEKQFQMRTTALVKNAEILKKEMTERKRAQASLEQQLEELKKYKSITVGRELEMIKLKEEINSLLVQLGQPKRFKANGISKAA